MSIKWDTSSDADILKIHAIKRLPWIGRNYKDQEVKTLILGESVYDWKPTDPANAKKISGAENLRTLHVNHAMDFKRNSKFVRNIERAIYAKKHPTDEEKKILWSSVVYHNLVTRVLKTKKHRPSYSDYYSGWETLDKLMHVLAPNEIIVYGLENTKLKSFKDYYGKKGIIEDYQKRSTRIGRSSPRVVTLNFSGRRVKFLFIRHPSAFFSWRKWAPVIHDETALHSILA